MCTAAAFSPPWSWLSQDYTHVRHALKAENKMLAGIEEFFFFFLNTPTGHFIRNTCTCAHSYNPVMATVKAKYIKPWCTSNISRNTFHAYLKPRLPHCLSWDAFLLTTFVPSSYLSSHGFPVCLSQSVRFLCFCISDTTYLLISKYCITS